MNEDLTSNLNEAVEAILSGAASANAPAGSELAALIPVAAALRGLPRESFRARLKEELMGTETIGTETMVADASRTTRPVREDRQTITPYLVVSRGAARLVDFVKDAFGAEESLRSTGSLGGIHAEVRIGDSVVMIGGDAPSPVGDAPAGLHLYVPDVDGVYAQALAAGGRSIKEPVEQPYGDREAGVKDPAGNTWWIATHRGAFHRPEGLRSVTPFLHPRGAAAMIGFLEQAFGAQEVERSASPEGIVHHATVRLGDSNVEMGEAHGENQPLPSQFFLRVAECDAVHERAVEAGAISLAGPADQPYGDRVASVKDPFGNTWYIATPLGRETQ